ncbi:DUF4129 domain-containing protein [Nocardia macrotermitis]|uniref:Protein-glutamine gamma-glutamyltransferase-like C-terminal domain-containing protein n=1 Tax=Nocardia macrotermitis TaxID=2585198 RepID=A0A7K0CX75_9NOCA|nr:DUF4129 domain-containing protein [Nocardia macrotermitis]MQY18096.1 hypothetical protein [Nocardia macrotermitis]
MVGVGTAIPRAIGLIALLALVVIALRGYLPGGSGPHIGSPPSVIAVALMPVLSLVSVVILLAGVITSQHRLPLALPDAHPDRVRRPVRMGRLGLFLVVGLAVLAVFGALSWAIYQLSVAHPVSPSQGSGARPTPVPPSTTGPPPSSSGPNVEPPLSTDAMIVIGVSAGALILAAIVGLIVVGVGTRRRVHAPAAEAEAAPVAPPVSLAQVAEMGLAAMIASGKDARAAIIACYVAMESGLARAREVAPLISDTPSEVLARAFDRGVLRDASARELVILFEEARFSPHSMLEWQRMRAEQLLRIVLGDLQRAES